MYQPKSSCGHFKLKKKYLFHIKEISLYNRTPLLRLKVKKLPSETKGQENGLIHVTVADLLVCGPLTDLRPGLMSIHAFLRVKIIKLSHDKLHRFFVMVLPEVGKRRSGEADVADWRGGTQTLRCVVHAPWLC